KQGRPKYTRTTLPRVVEIANRPYMTTEPRFWEKVEKTPPRMTQETAMSETVTLDEAWKAAEDACPPGWRVDRLGSGLADKSRWVAWAHGPWERIDRWHGHSPSVMGHADSPAAALLA